MMKKIVSYIIIASFAFLTISPFTDIVEAKTLQQYKNAVAELEKKKDNTDRLTAATEQKIRSKRNAIASATSTIESNKESVENSKLLVAESEEKIKIKNAELEDVIKILQYTGTNSEEMYLEYVFESSSVYELMERQSVVEQIIDYTVEELESLETLITENKQLQTQLVKDNKNLETSITKYENQLLDLQEEIEAQKGLIKIYEAAGCKNNDDIDICYYAKINGNGKFSRPLTKGKITQTWKNGVHYGIDLGGVPAGTNIYAPANGTIVYTKKKYRCGGNIIYMHAVVDGQKYTIEFAHLRSIKVKIGDVVKKGQVIATQGGDSSTWYYDSCTTGTHLHYSISYGYYFTNATWNGFSTFQKNTKATSVQSISGFKNQKGWKWTTRG